MQPIGAVRRLCTHGCVVCDFSDVFLILILIVMMMMMMCCVCGVATVRGRCRIFGLREEEAWSKAQQRNQQVIVPTSLFVQSGASVSAQREKAPTLPEQAAKSDTNKVPMLGWGWGSGREGVQSESGELGLIWWSGGRAARQLFEQLCL
jgi:hypothetical protein